MKGSRKLMAVLDAVGFVIAGGFSALAFVKIQEPMKSPWPWVLAVIAVICLILSFFGIFAEQKK
jgi:hypothetical protein